MAVNNSVNNIITGVTTNSSAAAGQVGEIISSVILNASSVAINSATATNLTSISLTAGDWDVWGNIYMPSTTTYTSVQIWISSTSATPPDNSLLAMLAATTSIIGPIALQAPIQRFSLSSTTNVFISAKTVSAAASTMCGGIYARRIR